MSVKINLLKGYRSPWYAFTHREVKLCRSIKPEVHRFFNMFDSPNRHLVLNPESGADVKLLVQGKLDFYPHLWKSYCEKFGPFLIEIFEETLSGDRLKMPKGTFDGFQGLINAVILARYVLEQKCVLQMSEVGRRIDPRLLSKNQSEFLAGALGRSDNLRWTDFAGKYKIHAAFQKFGASAQKMLEHCYPWAFNLSTPEGHHFHPWQFLTKGKWENDSGEVLARVALRHVFEKHLGFVMDMETRTIDERFFPGRYVEFLREQGAAETLDLFEKLGISGTINSVPRFRHKYVDAFISTWPWAFDLSTPEGKHLHYWDFFGKGFREQDESMIVARGKHILESHYKLSMNPNTGRISKYLLEDGGKRFLGKTKYENWSDFFVYSGIYRPFKDSGILGEDFSMVGILKKIYPWAFDLSKPEGKHIHFWRLINESHWTAGKMRAAILHSLGEDGLFLSDFPRVSERWFRDKGMGGIFDRFRSVYRIAKYVFEREFADEELQEGMFKTANVELIPSFRRVTSYVSNFYGKATIDGRNYCFPKKFIGLHVKRMSYDFGGLYNVDFDAEGNVTNRKLIYLFRLSDSDSYDAVHVKDADLVSFREQPFPNLQLLDEVNEVFLDFERSIYYFLMSDQIEFINLYKEKGASGVEAHLKKLLSAQ